MKLFFRILGVIFLVVLGLVLNFYLPSRDIVRIVGTDVVRMQVEQSQPGTGRGVLDGTRDVRLINTVEPDGDSQVYRNDDTGWGWPPYFKFDSADLAAVANNAISTEADPKWVVITSYGWRVALLSWFPNALDIRPAEGPEETLIPWFNIALVVLLLAIAIGVRRRILRLFGYS